MVFGIWRRLWNHPLLYACGCGLVKEGEQTDNPGKCNKRRIEAGPKGEQRASTAENG